jgi:hypothetical protein
MTRALAAAALAFWLTAAAQTGPAAPPAPGQVASVTFNRDVAPILYARCTECHRRGQIAPMSLMTYEEARPWARSIRRMVVEHRMPPWFADPHFGTFSNDSSLSDREVDLVTRWVDGGAPQGDPADRPALPMYDEGWRIGAPDLVLTVAQPFTLPATGLIDYQYFDIPTGLAADRWVQAVEIRPSDRRVLHHASVFVRAPGVEPSPNASNATEGCAAEICGDIEGVPLGETLTITAVGTPPEVYPAGTAKLLKARSVLRLQVHYTTIGEATADRLSVGLIFAKKAPSVVLKTTPLGKTNFTIPPRTSNYVLTATLAFQKDATLWSIGPHNHLRGRSWRFDLVEPDGAVRTLLSVPRFDFHWQLVYRFGPPITVARGSRLRATAVYDNTTANPANPDPDAEVRYGEQTKDEMMLAMVVYSTTS